MKYIDSSHFLSWIAPQLVHFARLLQIQAFELVQVHMAGPFLQQPARTRGWREKVPQFRRMAQHMHLPQALPFVAHCSEVLEGPEVHSPDDRTLALAYTGRHTGETLVRTVETDHRHHMCRLGRLGCRTPVQNLK